MSGKKKNIQYIASKKKKTGKKLNINRPKLSNKPG